MPKDFVIRDLLEKNLPKDFIDEFGEWAFGDKYQNLTHIQNYISEWNNLHGKSYQIRPHNTIAEDLFEMIDLWKRFKNEK